MKTNVDAQRVYEPTREELRSAMSRLHDIASLHHTASRPKGSWKAAEVRIVDANNQPLTFALLLADMTDPENPTYTIQLRSEPFAPATQTATAAQLTAPKGWSHADA